MVTRRSFLRATDLGVGAALGPLAGLGQQSPPPVPIDTHPSPFPTAPGEFETSPEVSKPVFPKPVVAIVLSGGFALGSFEVGALRYLYNQGIRPNILCGTSVGAINAAKLAEARMTRRPSLILTDLREEIGRAHV